MITSTANARVKLIRKLRDRKERRASNMAFVEGLRPVIEALQLNAGIEMVIIAPELITSAQGQSISEQAKSKTIEVMEVSAEVFRHLAVKEDPQGIAAVVRQRWCNLDGVFIKLGDLWIALVDVADPGNLGTIMRTMDAVGGKGVILLDHSTDPYDLTAIRASMGAVFSMKLVSCGLDELSAWKAGNQVHIIGSDGSSNLDYQALDYPERMVLMMGSERQGLSDNHKALCDQLVRIPMVGRSDSLNLGVAASVVLYEVFNQKRSRGKKI